jgi:NADPH:quinone reductase-like Zn-dependent oxidoreductase
VKAVNIHQFGNRDVLKLENVEKPALSEGEVLIRIHASGVNPVDWKIREGYLKDFIPHEFPVILGWEMAGVVEETGHAARRFKPADEVYAYCRRPVIQKGTYAEYIAIPEAYLSKKPKNLSFEEAAGIPLAGLTAYQALFDAAGLKKGENILVMGASGGVGSYAVQLAKIAGAKVAALASRKNQEYLRGLGADHFLDYESGNFQSVLRQIFKEGADVVFDCVGGETLRAGQDCVRDGGRIVSIVDEPDEEFLKKKQVESCFKFVEPNSSQLDILRGYVEAGKLKVSVASVFSLEEAAKAHEKIESGHTRGKIVLKI